MTTVTVKRATDTDVSELAPMFDRYRQFYGQPSAPQAAAAFLRARMAKDESVVFIASIGTTPVGFTQLYPSFSSVSMVRVFVLNDLFVDEAYREQGVGARLIAAAVTHGRAAGAKSLSLQTSKHNAKAQALYRASGWQPETEYIEFCYALAQ